MFMDMLKFFFCCLGICAAIAIAAIAYMSYTAAPFPYDENDEDW